MLFDEKILSLLADKLKKEYPNFNIHVFLQLLLTTSRPLGYPPYEKGIDELYYLELIRTQIALANETRNGRQREKLMSSMWLIMVCFCYVQETLCKHGVDEELFALLSQAIDARIDSTEEECCAENSLLAMLVNKPADVLQLLTTYYRDLQWSNVKILLLRQIRERQYIRCSQFASQPDEDNSPKSASQPDEDGQPIELAVREKMTANMAEAINCAEVLEVTKSTCLAVIGFYLLNHADKLEQQGWIKENPRLWSVVEKEMAKKDMVATKEDMEKQERGAHVFFQQCPQRAELHVADQHEPHDQYLNDDHNALVLQGHQHILKP